MLAIIGWLALVALCGWLSFFWVVFARLGMAFGWSRRDFAILVISAPILVAGWYGIAIVAPFQITIS